MKNLSLFSFILLSLISLNSNAQNAIDVRSFISPALGLNFAANATTDIEIRFRNDGPQTLFSQDSITFDLSIATADTTEFYTIRKRVNFTLNPLDIANYVLIPNYTFKSENDYVICVTVNGTDDYPLNTNKNPRSCVAFTVGINAIDVSSFNSPTAGFNYDSSATEDIEIRFSNDGPQTLFAQDSITFELSISTTDTTEFYTIRKRVNFTLNASDIANYVLIPNYTFRLEDDYVICATVNGTDDYPKNSNSNPRTCVAFAVGIEDIELELNHVFFNGNSINFNLNENASLTAYVFDLTGRILAEKKLSNGVNQSLDFSAPANGFYFLKVINSKGQSAIAKFIAN